MRKHSKSGRTPGKGSKGGMVRTGIGTTSGSLAPEDVPKVSEEDVKTGASGAPPNTRGGVTGPHPDRAAGTDQPAPDEGPGSPTGLPELDSIQGRTPGRPGT